MKRAACVLGLLIALVAFAPSSEASSFVLNVDHCTGGCGTPPFGTVTLAGSGTITVDVLLAPGVNFWASGFPGSFAFNLAGSPALTFGGLSAGWSVTPTALAQKNGPLKGYYHYDGFGGFEHSLTWTPAHSGDIGPSSLHFTLTATGLEPAWFETESFSGAPGVFFVADVVGPTGLTGPVGGSSVPQVPEPASMLLLGTGLLGAGFAARRRKK